MSHSRAMEQEASERIAGTRSSDAVLAMAYLVGLALAEALTVLAEPSVGLIAHSLLLLALLRQASLTHAVARRTLLLVLTLAPLIRLLSLSIPLSQWPLLYWYAVISVPLFIGTLVIVRTLRWSTVTIGLTLDAWPVQGAVALSGLALGYAEYLILRPRPLAPNSAWPELLGAGLILVVCTGFAEELIFRGAMQTAAVRLFGRAGVVYVAVMFAILHLGYHSVADLAFVFAVGLFFGWIVYVTGSLVGATLAHGLTNVVLLLVAPNLSGAGVGASTSLGSLEVLALLAMVGAVAMLVALAWSLVAGVKKSAAAREVRH